MGAPSEAAQDERTTRSRPARAAPAGTRLGRGQVQSVIGDRVTVNFEHAGKLLINAAVVRLELVKDDPAQDDQLGR
jgi:hypothetical protein